MVAHDELGGLLPIKRTIRVIDAQNQSFREQEVRARKGARRGSFGGKRGGFESRPAPPLTFPRSAAEGRRRAAGAAR